MSARECILVVDDDRLVTDGLSLLLERDDRTTIVCSDLESAEIILARHPVTHLISDVQFSGEFGFEGLHFLTRVRIQRPHCRIVLMTGYASDGLRGAAMGLGADVVLAKPFTADELERALGATRPLGGTGSPYQAIHVQGIDDVLHGDLLRTAYQPIVRTDGDSVTTFGFEALTRIQGSWAGGGAAELFDYATRRDRLSDLNLAALECSIANAASLPPDAVLFVNTDPTVFAGGALTAALRGAAKRHRFPLSRMVLEITERSGFDDGVAPEVFERLRGEGVRFALDDHGSAYSHLSVINVIRPTFIKISQTFGTAFEEDPTRARIVKHVVALAHDFGCQTVLEGVESASTARAATALGVDLIQGYHFGRPHTAAHWSEPVSCTA